MVTYGGKALGKPEGYLVERLGYGHARAGMEPRHAKCPAYMRGYKKGLTEQKKPVKL